jgi:ketosteroid isomerase-like protein
MRRCGGRRTLEGETAFAQYTARQSQRGAAPTRWNEQALTGGGSPMTTLVEKSKLTVDSLIARRHEPRTYQEKVQHALDVVGMHLQEENPERIDECIRLYTDDAVWEAPARKVSYQGRDLIKKMYLRVFNGVVDFEFTPVERFATPDRVFDDSYASFKITGDAFENCPYPIGTKVKMRLIHNFHIHDGLISREIGYEVWRRAD